ncbi:MAG: sulfite exporter TauE/SafE family protein [Oscillospiraceae bacterium]|nr:sulfite exporter TauE/SafE family protein [Oscillospiraceae bacterium]
MEISKTRSALSGAAAGLINGLLGAGGGMVLVPLLVGWCGLEDKKAFATAISIILPLSLTSIAVFAMREPLPFGEAWPYLLGGVIGGGLGGLLFKKMTANVLHKLLGAVILWGGVQLLMR